jgi:uncharacterized protein YjbJ (UPF0337 family)
MADRNDNFDRNDELYEAEGRASGVTWQASARPDEVDMFTAEDVETETDDGVEAHRVRIEQTRADMTETIDAIQEKLSPGHMAAQAKDAVKDATVGRAQDMMNDAGDTAKGFGYTIIESIKQNPVPAAIAGFGLGWLFMSSRQTKQTQGRTYRDYTYPSDYYGRRTDYGYRTGYGYRYDSAPSAGDRFGQAQHAAQDTASRVAGTVQDTAGQMAGTVQDTASQVAGTVQDTAGQVVGSVQDTAGQVAGQVQGAAGQMMDQAQYGAYRAQTGFQQLLEERPLVVGAVAVALGAAVGLAIPETPQEQQIMGEARDTLMDRAQQTVQETAQKVTTVAQEAASAAKDAAQDAAQEHGLTADSSTM